MVLLGQGYRYFLAVAECRSIREAADRLRISQSAISRQIQNLELSLGCELFDRGSRGVVPTAAGLVLLRFVRESGDLSSQLTSELHRLRGEQSGHVSISVVEGFATNGLLEVLTEFNAYNPAVTLEVLVESSVTIKTGVEESRYDIGVLFNPHSQDLNIIAQVDVPLCALVASSHPLARKSSVSIHDLTEFPLVIPAGSGGSREMYEAACRTLKLPIRSLLETNSAHVGAAFILGLNGIGILSPHAAAPYITQGKLVAIRLREPVFNSGHLAVVTRAGRILTSAGEILCSMLCRSVVSLRS